MNALPALDRTVAVAYRRVSSAEQERASGPQRQRDAIRRYTRTHGLTLAADHFEDISGTLPMSDRAQLSAALSSCLEHGAGLLLVEERSRLARDEYAAHDALRAFGAAGVRIVYADGPAPSAQADDPAARLADGFGHLLAAYDRRQVVARMAAGREAKAKANPRSRAQGGRLPHGYRRSRSGGVEVDPDTSQEVRECFRLMAQGNMSVRKVADAMTASTGRTWQPTAVARILAREEYKRQDPAWAIVHHSTWTKAHDAMARRRRGQ